MPITRRPGALAVTVGLLLLTAACGSSPPSSSTSSTRGTSSTSDASSSGTGGVSAAYVADKLGFARCLRAHGVPTFPDPNASGQEPTNWKQLTFTPQGQAAVGACSYWGNRIHNDIAAQNQAATGEYVRFARCMRPRPPGLGC